MWKRPAPRPLEASPSSRRAWIEMEDAARTPFDVASPSSRRAWIEITMRRL